MLSIRHLSLMQGMILKNLCHREVSMVTNCYRGYHCIRTPFRIMGSASVLNRSEIFSHFVPCSNLHGSVNLVRNGQLGLQNAILLRSNRGFHATEILQESSKESSSDQNDGTVKMKTRVKIVVFLLATWGAVYFAAKYNRGQKNLEERDTQLQQVDIGASDYELVDQNGKTRTKKDFLGQWFLLYFGFSHCPDICPEELEKMAEIIDLIDNDKSVNDLLPVFVSVDPERDSPDVIKKYLEEFHPKFVGLTGSKEQVKQAAKAFRVYFSAGPRDEDNDYIVDHTIVMYLMNPQGNFVDYYGSRGVSTSKIVESIKQNMKNYRRLHG